MSAVLNKEFFNRPADVVARQLLGSYLCVKTQNGTERHIINETEAYMGPDDLACHASRGRTRRTEVMFGEPGTIYVYLIYGMYDMLNIVTGEREYPAAVLIRGAGDLDGPGKLTKALSITRAVNGEPLSIKTGLWVEAGDRIDASYIESTPRIGVGYAKEWADHKLRYLLTDA